MNKVSSLGAKEGRRQSRIDPTACSFFKVKIEAARTSNENNTSKYIIMKMDRRLVVVDAGEHHDVLL